MYRMKCHQTGLAFCLFVAEIHEQPAVGDLAPQPINRTCIYYVCCTRGCMDIYQGVLVLSNIPLVISHWATHTHTRTRALEKMDAHVHRGQRTNYSWATTKEVERKKEHERPSSIEALWLRLVRAG